jgi:hypothetical protein
MVSGLNFNFLVILSFFQSPATIPENVDKGRTGSRVVSWIPEDQGLNVRAGLLA